MRKMTKLTSMVATIAMLSSIGMTVLAGNYETAPTTNHGTLIGQMYKGFSSTTVTSNLNSASLRVNGQFVDVYGNKIDGYYSVTYGQELRVDHGFDYPYPNVPVYAIYGAHEVLGSHPAGVYTYCYVGDR